MMKYLALDVVKIRSVFKLILRNRSLIGCLTRRQILIGQPSSIDLKTVSSIFGYCAYKTYQTNGEWLQTKIDFVSEKIAPLIKKK